MEALHALTSSESVSPKLLGEPSPSAAERETAFRAAMTAPEPLTRLRINGIGGRAEPTGGTNSTESCVKSWCVMLTVTSTSRIVVRP